MLTITDYSVEFIKDPFGILQGKRYEFILDIEVPEDDELFSEQGLYIRVIYSVDGDSAAITKHDIFERNTKHYVEFDLEEEELKVVDSFCKAHYQEADE
jgi:hypothetical protein